MDLFEHGELTRKDMASLVGKMMTRDWMEHGTNFSDTPKYVYGFDISIKNMGWLSIKNGTFMIKHQVLSIKHWRWAMNTTYEHELGLVETWGMQLGTFWAKLRNRCKQQVNCTKKLRILVNNTQEFSKKHIIDTTTHVPSSKFGQI